MADYHAILKRTLDGLGDTTPQLRAKLFERARVTIERQLETANPPMSGEAIAAQKAHLEAAIASIENEFQIEQPVEAPPIAQQTAVVEQQVPHDANGQADDYAEVAVVDEPDANVPVETPRPLTEEHLAARQERGVETQAVSDEPVDIPPVEEDLYMPAGTFEPVRRSSKLPTLIRAPGENTAIKQASILSSGSRWETRYTPASERIEATAGAI